MAAGMQGVVPLACHTANLPLFRMDTIESSFWVYYEDYLSGIPTTVAIDGLRSDIFLLFRGLALNPEDLHKI